MMKQNKAQQEIAGFVLIVVIVMIALMIFLVISLRKSSETPESVEVENLLNSVLKQTTECAAWEPNFDTIENVIKKAYITNERCANLGIMAEEYLNKTLVNILDAVIETERKIGAYQIYISEKESGERLFDLKKGECIGSVRGASAQIIAFDKDNLDVRLIVC